MAVKTTVEAFDSINQFYKYLCDTPFNGPFLWHDHASVNNDYQFTQTKSFEQAVRLMREGWSAMSATLTQKLQVATKRDGQVYRRRDVLSVSGYQPIVPLYLAGVPTNMVSKQLVAVKSKIIDIVKLVNYSSLVSSDTIQDESVKALRVVKKLEAQGYRCNLYIALGTWAGTETEQVRIVCKVKVKGASERLNISKLAFPMVHPSMLRRLFFRFIEVHPSVTKSFVDSYGYPIKYPDMQKILKGDIVLPSIFTEDVEKIVDLESLRADV